MSDGILPSGRWIGLQALLLCRDEGLLGPEALERAWAESGATMGDDPDYARERGLSMGLLQGVLRWEIKLDGIVSRLSHNKGGGDIHPTARAILHLGLYQLLFMDRIPERAAVSETVALTRPARVGFASGFVNGCLRRFIREREALEPSQAKGLRFLAETYAHPRHFVRAIAPALGGLEGDLEAYLKASQELPPITLRVNTLTCPDPEDALEALRDEGVPFELSPFLPRAFRLVGSQGRPDTLPGFAEGHLTVQDEASQLMVYLLGAEPGMRALDACAAPGGKAALLAQELDLKGALWAVDPSDARLDLMTQGFERLGTESFVTVRRGRWAERPDEADLGSNPTLGPDEAQELDRILVDAPCTAWGVVRRHPEIKAKRTPEDPARMAGLQLGILRDVSLRLKPGGVMVYSVCSPLPEEGEGVVAAFLAEHPEFSVEAPPEIEGVDFAPFLTELGALRTWPHRHGTDAFFGVRLRRQTQG